MVSYFPLCIYLLFIADAIITLNGSCRILERWLYAGSVCEIRRRRNIFIKTNKLQLSEKNVTRYFYIYYT